MRGPTFSLVKNMKYYIMIRPPWDDVDALYKECKLSLWTDCIGPFDSIEAIKTFVTQRDIKYAYIERRMTPENYNASKI